MWWKERFRAAPPGFTAAHCRDDMVKGSNPVAKTAKVITGKNYQIHRRTTNEAQRWRWLRKTFLWLPMPMVFNIPLKFERGNVVCFAVGYLTKDGVWRNATVMNIKLEDDVRLNDGSDRDLWYCARKILPVR